MNKISIREIKTDDLLKIWELSYRDHLEWMKWNGPYFKDPVYSKEEFLNEHGPKYYLNNPRRCLIAYQEEIMGVLSYHFEDNPLNYWPEIGIVIFNKNAWGQGIGQKSLKIWLDQIFTKYPHVQRIGFTTWSGNIRMMALGEKLGMKREAEIRQVRYYEGQYWDSIKYGILRNEFYA